MYILHELCRSPRGKETSDYRPGLARRILFALETELRVCPALKSLDRRDIHRQVRARYHLHETCLHQVLVSSLVWPKGQVEKK